jgi:hypothetical protein
MNDPQDTRDLECLWTSNPLDSDHTIQEWEPLPVSWGGVVREEPSYIRDISPRPGVVLQLVTTRMLERGYLPRGVDDYLLCKIDDKGDGSGATLTFVNMCRTLAEADAWLTEPSE